MVVILVLVIVVCALLVYVIILLFLMELLLANLQSTPLAVEFVNVKITLMLPVHLLTVDQMMLQLLLLVLTIPPIQILQQLVDIVLMDQLLIKMDVLLVYVKMIP
jgi:hypothetical protein